MCCIVVCGIGVELTTKNFMGEYSCSISQTNTSTTTHASATITTTTTTTTTTTSTTAATITTTSKHIIVKNENQTCTQEKHSSKHIKNILIIPKLKILLILLLYMLLILALQYTSIAIPRVLTFWPLPHTSPSPPHPHNLSPLHFPALHLPTQPTFTPHLLTFLGWLTC